MIGKNHVKDSVAGDIMSNRVETTKDPIANVGASPNYRGKITLAAKQITQSAYDAEKVCAAKAINTTDGKQERIAIDIGKCILCGRCQEVAPDLFKMDSGFSTPAEKRQDLVESLDGKVPADESYEKIGEKLKDRINKMFGRSLAIREVDAGSCNGCEVEITALNNPIYDIERFGIHFVASPRHADVLLVTGPASRNMEMALRRTYEATPGPKIVIAVGACACSGGIFGDTYATTGGIDKVVPVDVYIPGCPPKPEALLYGLLMAMDRIRPEK